MTNIQIQTLVNEQWNIIHDREAKLRNTDYIAVKIAEGAATKEEYQDKINIRQSWRVDINAAQAELERLSNIEPEQEIPEIDQ